METEVLVMGFLVLTTMLLVSVMAWYYMVADPDRLYRAMYGLLAVFSSTIAGALIVKLITW